MKLKIADGLSLPLEAVTQKFAWLGVTGSGKTYGASKLAELLWHTGAQFVVLDPVGVWYGLRLTKDGKKPSAITIPIFGGLHGDVPLEPTGGALLANLLVDETLSAIIDVSQFESDAQKARFALDFADRFFFRKKAAPSAVHLFLEECQEFVPQNPQKGEERMLHAFTRMQKLGRNFGIGSSYISQRPQEVNKKALNMAQTLFVFRTTGTHERTAIEKWIEDKSLDESIANDLPKIPTGDCHVWSPEFLKISETVHIIEKETFNASATPEVGVVAKARELAPIDLEQVRHDMAATIEKAKADDPRELRKQIAELKKELGIIQAGRNSTDPYKSDGKSPKRVEVLTDADRALLEKVGAKLAELQRLLTVNVAFDLTDFLALFDKLVKHFAEDVHNEQCDARDAFMAVLEGKGFQKILGKLANVQPPPQNTPATMTQRVGRHVPVSPHGRRADPGVSAARPASVVPASSNGHGHLPPGERAVLTAVAQYPQGASREQITVLTGYKRSTRDLYLQQLGRRGAVQSAGGDIRVTPTGLDLLGPDFEPLPTGEALIEHWRQRLPPGERAVFEIAVAARGGPVDRDAISHQTGYKRSTRDLYLQLLQRRKLISTARDGVRANEELFL